MTTATPELVAMLANRATEAARNGEWVRAADYADSLSKLCDGKVAEIMAEAMHVAGE